MTNEEWLKSLSCEELFDLICRQGLVDQLKPSKLKDMYCVKVDGIRQCHITMNCKQCFINWLKQEHKDDKQ